ncbi:hypothetical protein [Leisingera daeponensis]|uniref:hypothetical protein n=1 Tax=Leisingera daeponensis TaxID=405746 RepID=UPI001C93945B|nr:hypothetical protein [Leisingera daeponensis]MBY6059026.1 hypothetical protein [Leisingera daeponensis]
MLLAPAAQLLQRAPLAALRVVTDSLPQGDPLRGSVLLLGNFDGFHRGHQALLDEAVLQGGGRPVGLMSCEPHPRSFFAPDQASFRLTTPCSKLAVAGDCGAGFVFMPRFDGAFAGLSPEAFIKDVLVARLAVSHVVTGPDFRFGSKRRGDIELLDAMGRKLGFGVTAVQTVQQAGERTSSSRIRALLAAGDFKTARACLGHDWLVETIWHSEAGLQLHPMLCRPKPGIYRARQGRRGGSAAALNIAISADGSIRSTSPGFRAEPGLLRLQARVG